MLVCVTHVLAGLVVQRSQTKHLIACTLVMHVLVACMLVACVNLLRTPWSYIGGSSTCIIVYRRYENPTTAPICDPRMARLPWGLQKLAIGMFIVLGLMHHKIVSMLWFYF